MRPLIVSTRAPSNIALIKYMGKEDAAANLPANPSLSMTLDRLCTIAELRLVPGAPSELRWVPEIPAAAQVRLPGAAAASVPDLSQAGVARLVRQVGRARRLLPEFFHAVGLDFADPMEAGAAELRAANTFPPASGIASSASSFAAITLAVAAACARDGAAFERALAGGPEFRRALAGLSRQGSGSSCRSFEGPWVLWEGAYAAALEVPAMPEMVDLVLVTSAEAKAVGSSEAHARVLNSPLWEGRVDRVRARLRSVEGALGEGDLRTLARVAWSESWEMHSLFHTAAEPFTYWEPGSVEALRWLAPFVLGGGSATPPVVTMDAGPNLHVLVPAREAPDWAVRIHERFPEFGLLEDVQGKGARVVSREER